MCTYLGLLLTDVYRFGPPPQKKKSGTLPLATNSPSSCFITMIMCKKFPMIKHKRCWDQISTLKCVQSPTNSCSLYLLCNMQISYHLIFQTKFPTNIGEQELFFFIRPRPGTPGVRSVGPNVTLADEDIDSIPSGGGTWK